MLLTDLLISPESTPMHLPASYHAAASERNQQHRIEKERDRKLRVLGSALAG
jgi:hypothetical protein